MYSALIQQRTVNDCEMTSVDTRYSPVGPVVFPFLGSEMGGSHVSTFALARALRSDFGVACIVLAAANTLIASEAGRLGLEVRPTDEQPAMRHNPIYDLVKFGPRLKLLRNCGKSAIVHCNDMGALQSWGPVAKTLGLPVVYHHRAFNKMFLLNRLLMHMADRVICISEACRRTVGFLPEKSVCSVFNPFSMAIDIDRVAARATFLAGCGFALDTILVGFVGNFWGRKRAEFFLDVCAAIAKRNDRARFVLFGRSGDIREAQLIERAEDRGIGRRTFFAGFRLPMDENIASLDLLIAPALNEPFGRTLVEALLLGTPYVATADAGHSEIASRWAGGMLIDPSATVEQFADTAILALTETAKIVLGPERRSEISQELSARVHAGRILAAYRSVEPCD